MTKSIDGMTFESTPINPAKSFKMRHNANKHATRNIEDMGSWRIVAFLTLRHKFELVTVYALCATYVLWSGGNIKF